MLTIYSGGQTGVDQAALRAAKAAGLPTGGWAPKSWLTEDGYAPWLADYGLCPHQGGYAARTRENVAESDATLLVLPAGVELSGGSELTARYARLTGKPVLVVYLDDPPGFAAGWVSQTRVLNVAGPRESKHPGIGEAAEAFLLDLFRRAKGGTP